MPEATPAAGNACAKVILAFDFGLRRIGVACGDTISRSASPLQPVGSGPKGPEWDKIAALMRDWQPNLAVVGLPYNVDGSESAMAGAARTFATELALRHAIEVQMVDERYSSQEAGARLKSARQSGLRKRKVGKADVDAAAACVILERWFTEKTEAQMRSQQDSAGGLRHLVTLEGLARDTLTALLDRAESYRRLPGQPAYEGRELAGVTLANLFFEPSTRTRASFDLASRRLGAHVLNLDVHSSSRVKGETMLDTIYTLEAMNTDVFVIRDSEAGMPEFLIDHVAPHVSVISAGEAHVSHPTQGLLDMLTIRSHKRRFAGLKVAIVGDVKHSRVARSAATALATLGTTDLRLVAPEALLPEEGEFRGAQRFTRIEDGIAGADVIMMLRIQKERMAAAASLDDAAYFQDFGLTQKRVKLASPSVLIMHPGPMNRGVEIASEVADGPRSVIREQVNNGVAVRMAVLASIAVTLTRHRRPL